MMTLAFLVAIPLPPFGTVHSMSGLAYWRTRGIVVRLDRKSVGRTLRLGDDVKVVRGSLVVKTAWGLRTFRPSPGWQPLLVPTSDDDRKAYAALQRAFDAAVVRKGGGLAYPTEGPTPCALFTIVGSPGPFRVRADGDVLYDEPKLDRLALVRALLDARDRRGAKRIVVAAGGATITTTLMPRAEEGALLAELAAAGIRPLARAVAFARHGQLEFARYELDRLGAGAPLPLRRRAARVVAVRPPL